MRADPFDPNDSLLDIDRHHKTIVITFYIEDDPLRADDTRRGIATLDFRGALPRSLAHFVEPCLQRRSYRRLVLPAGKALDELSQCPASNNPHCSQYTLVPLWEQQAYCGFIAPPKRFPQTSPPSMPWHRHHISQSPAHRPASRLPRSAWER